MRAARDKPFFIVFEGLDGAGKTTCAKLLADMTGARYMTTPCKSLREQRQSILNCLGSSQEAVQLFYLATVFAAANEIRQLNEAGVSVVLDRYFLSTQAYAQFRGSALELDRIGDLLFPADLTVYLNAPLATRRKRVVRPDRQCTTADGETLTEDADQILRNLYFKRSTQSVVGEWLRVESSDIEPEQVVQAVLQAAHLFPRLDNLPPTRT
jgi:dTMP kinase